jgi:hypothetical protein
MREESEQIGSEAKYIGCTEIRVRKPAMPRCKAFDRVQARLCPAQHEALWKLQRLFRKP